MQIMVGIIGIFAAAILIYYFVILMKGDKQ